MGIDNDGIHLTGAVEGFTRRGVEIAGESEIAAIGAVDVDPEAVFRAQFEDFWQRVDGSHAGGSEGHHHAADVARREQGFERGQIHAPAGIRRHFGEGQPENAADAFVRVVGLFGGDDLLVRMQPAGHPESFQIGDGAAAGEVSQVGVPAEHGGDLRDRFLLHGGTGAAAIERVVVGIDPRGQRIGRARYRVRRFQHLPGIERVEIREIIRHAGGHFGHYRVHSFAAGDFRGEGGQAGEILLKVTEAFGQQLQRSCLKHSATYSGTGPGPDRSGRTRAREPKYPWRRGTERV